MGQREPCLAQFAITSRLDLFTGLCWPDVLVCCVKVNWNRTYTAYSAIDDGFGVSDGSANSTLGGCLELVLTVRDNIKEAAGAALCPPRHARRNMAVDMMMET